MPESGGTERGDVRLWYFFISVGVFLVSGLFFFSAFSVWERGRNDSTYQPRPKLVALCAGAGVVGLGACVYLLSL